MCGDFPPSPVYTLEKWMRTDFLYGAQPLLGLGDEHFLKHLLQRRRKKCFGILYLLFITRRYTSYLVEMRLAKGHWQISQLGRRAGMQTTTSRQWLSTRPCCGCPELLGCKIMRCSQVSCSNVLAIDGLRESKVGNFYVPVDLTAHFLA